MTDAATQDNQPVYSIEKIYVKDLSLEVPNAPQIFLEREAPQVDVQLHHASSSPALSSAESSSNPPT